MGPKRTLRPWVNNSSTMTIIICFVCAFYFICCECLPACMFVHHLHAWCVYRPERGNWIPGTGVLDDCETPCGYWELNPGSLEQQPVLLTAKPSLHPHENNYFWPVLGRNILFTSRSATSRSVHQHSVFLTTSSKHMRHPHCGSPGLDTGMSWMRQSQLLRDLV